MPDGFSSPRRHDGSATPVRRLALLWLLLPIGYTALAGCQRQQTSEKATVPRPVSVATVRSQPPQAELTVSGAIESWSEQDISFEVSGRIDVVARENSYLEGRWEDVNSVSGENGSETKREVIVQGDRLARLDPQLYQAAVRSAQAQVRSAEANVNAVIPAEIAAATSSLNKTEDEYKRKQRLRDSRTITEEEFNTAKMQYESSQAQLQQANGSLDAAKADLDQARAELNRAELNLERTELYAPFTGEVSEVYVQPGGYVNAGQAVAHLVMMDPIIVKITVSPQTSRQLSRDDSVDLLIDDFPEPLHGAVYTKSTSADPETRTFEVSIIARNQKVFVRQPADPSITKLPRISQLFPLSKPEIAQPGPVFVAERPKGLYQDADGYYVWAVEGINLQRIKGEVPMTFTVRKVRVQVGEERINLQGIYLAREITDAGGLEFGQALAVGVPDGVKDGDQVAMLHERWILNPGGIVSVRLPIDDTRSGIYVPVEAIVPQSNERGFIYRVESSGDSGHSGVAQRIEVQLGKSDGKWQQVEPLEEGVIVPGDRIVVEGSNLVQPEETLNIINSK